MALTPAGLGPLQATRELGYPQIALEGYESRRPTTIVPSMEPIKVGAVGGRGWTRKQLRGPFWWSPTTGVVMVASERDNLAARCRALAVMLSEIAVFTNVTSAQLRGWWLPSGIQQWPVIACTAGTAPHHDRRGVYVRRCAIPPEHRVSLDGLAVASAEWTIIELAEDLSLIDLVVVIDAAPSMEDCTKASIAAAIVPRRRGVKRLRRALALADDCWLVSVSNATGTPPSRFTTTSVRSSATQRMPSASSTTQRASTVGSTSTNSRP